jgi:hypothetical protein
MHHRRRDDGGRGPGLHRRRRHSRQGHDSAESGWRAAPPRPRQGSAICSPTSPTSRCSSSSASTWTLSWSATPGPSRCSSSSSSRPRPPSLRFSRRPSRSRTPRV